MTDTNTPTQRGRLAGKVAIVTGSGKGIGLAEVSLFAREGARVVVNDIATDGGVPRAELVAAELRDAGHEAVASTADVGSFGGAQQLVQAALDAYGRLDVLVNNAGLRGAGSIDELTEEQFDTVIDTHLRATFGMIKYAAPVFKAQRSGVIINTGSESGLGHPYNSAYAAAKEGIAGLTRSIARELAPFGVRCNLLRPRADTAKAPEFDAALARWSSEIRALGPYRLGERGQLNEDVLPSSPEAVANVVAWLCSDSASALNGCDFFVQGSVVGMFTTPRLTNTASRPEGWDIAALEEFMPQSLLLGARDFFAEQVRSSTP